MKKENDIGITVLLFIFHLAALGFIGVIIIETNGKPYYIWIKNIIVSVAILIGGIINIYKLIKQNH